MNKRIIRGGGQALKEMGKQVQSGESEPRKEMEAHSRMLLLNIWFYSVKQSPTTSLTSNLPKLKKNHPELYSSLKKFILAVVIIAEPHCEYEWLCLAFPLYVSVFPWPFWWINKISSVVSRHSNFFYFIQSVLMLCTRKTSLHCITISGSGFGFLFEGLLSCYKLQII